MSEHEHETTSQDEKGSVSEGGSSALNADTALGGADSVPDTPDVNTAVSDAVDVNEPSQEGAPPSDPTQPD